MSDDIISTAADIPVNIEDIMHTAYLQYSLSVNVGRAIPDVRDGLKPGNRRILYAMRMLGLTQNHSYTKCAKVVGEVIGNYHPHGDSSVYDTMVRMAQEFAMRYPLVDGQGNFGSIDGDSAAAYRYTECRLFRLAEEMLTDIDKNTVDMAPTFDEKGSEPTVLPARFPNLLVMGSTGIGVGMATNIPPHNLTEVINATIHLIDSPMASNRELMDHVKGPDFPTGATIVGVQPLIDLYETGHGIITLRAKSHFEETKTGGERIVVTEIPYALKKEDLVRKIANLVNHKVITGISGLNDESSSRVGIRIVIDIKRNDMASVVLNQLYKHSQLQTSFGATLLCVNKNRPQVMNLSQVLQAYIDHRFDVITRRCQYELAKAEARAHILEGLLIAVDNIDEVVKIIRASRTREEAGNRLTERFDLSKKQTTAILDMRLHQLTGLAMDDIKAEYEAVMARIAELKALLASRTLLMGVVKDELIEVRDKHGDERRTDITVGANEINIEDLIQREIVAVTVTNTGYIKRQPLDSFRTQHRGGKGVMGMQTKEEDWVEHMFTACTHDYLLFFTDKGRMLWRKVYELPEGQRNARGKAIINLIEIEKDEQIRAMLTVDAVDDDEKYLVFATRNGVVKKTVLSKFKNLRRKGIRAIGLDEEDDLIGVRLTDGEKQVMLFSAQGMACRFKEDQARTMGRTARGVIGIRLGKKENDSVVGMTAVEPCEDVLLVTSSGMGKRSNIGHGIAELDQETGGYRLTNRGGKGVTGIKLKDGDSVVGALPVLPGDEMLITTVNGLVVRISTDEIRTIGRASQGVKIIDLRDKDKVASVSIVHVLEAEDEDEEGDGESEGGEEASAEGAEGAAEVEASTEAEESAKSADDDAADDADAEVDE
jgi:DNA gyrase subunit A